MARTVLKSESEPVFNPIGESLRKRSSSLTILPLPKDPLLVRILRVLQPRGLLGVSLGLAQAAVAAVAVAILGISLGPRRGLPSFAVYIPGLIMQLAAPHLGFASLAAATFSAFQATRAGCSTVGVLHGFSSCLTYVFSLLCGETVRRAFVDRAIFADTIKAKVFSKSGNAKSDNESSVELCNEIGHMSATRLLRSAFVLPALEWSQLSVQRGVRFATVNGRARRLDVIRRTDAKVGAPALLYFHGGGFIAGDKAFHSMPLLYTLALDAGWVIFSANYETSRLDLRPGMGGATFPDHLHDCFRALAWARSPWAQKYGGGGSTLVVGGESAGGTLACLVGLTHQIPRMRPPELREAEFRVDAVIDLYGVHDPSFTGKAMLLFFRHFILRTDDPDVWHDATPLWWVEQAAIGNAPSPPPFFSVHGVHDVLVPIKDARRFDAAMREMRSRRQDQQHVEDVYVEVPRAIHGFNFTHSPLSYALSDAALLFLESVQQPATKKLNPSKL